MRIHHEGVAKQARQHPDDHGRNDGWIRNQNHGRTVRAENPKSSKSLKDVFERGHGGSLELQIMNQVRTGSELLREGIASAAVRIPGNERPRTMTAVSGGPRLEGRSHVRIQFARRHDSTVGLASTGRARPSPQSATADRPVSISPTGTLQPAVSRYSRPSRF